MSSQLPPFHLAIPVDDLDAAREFYCGLLGCATGRAATRWIDLNFFGHQLTLHLASNGRNSDANAVDGDAVPVRHFGVILEMNDWQSLAGKLQTADCEFLIAPKIRFKDEIGQQATMFLLDPAGNALEFKSFADSSQIFAR